MFVFRASSSWSSLRVYTNFSTICFAFFIQKYWDKNIFWHFNIKKCVRLWTNHLSDYLELRNNLQIIYILGFYVNILVSFIKFSPQSVFIFDMTKVLLYAKA